MRGCGSINPDWPETLFARAVRRALERILTYVGNPGMVEEADAAAAALDAAAGYASDHSARTLIVVRLRQMLHDIDIIPDYQIGEPPRSLRPPHAVLVGARNGLVGLVRFVEDGDRDGLDHARAALWTAAKREPSGQSRRRRDEGYLFDYLGRLCDELELKAYRAERPLTRP